MQVNTKEFTEIELRELWSKDGRITLDNISYRVGRMSYGDYFFEPGIDQGEMSDFNRETLWLKRSEENKRVFVIA